MNWTTIAAWSQICGVVGVLGTLAYLAAQLRANTKVVRTQNIHHVTDSFNSINLLIASNAELADLFNRGSMNYDDLPSAEKTQFAFICLAAFRVYDTLYLHIRRGTGERELWDSEIEALRWFFTQAGFRSWWSQQKFAFSPGFREFIEAEVREKGGPDA